MESAEIRSLVLFFFFAFLDEKLALECAGETYAKLNHQMKKHPHQNRQETLWSLTYQMFLRTNKKIKKSFQPNTVRTDLSETIQGPIGLGAWREFQKAIDSEELVVVIYRQILNLTDQQVAACMNITEGTVRYRLGKALPRLGASL